MFAKITAKIVRNCPISQALHFFYGSPSTGVSIPGHSLGRSHQVQCGSGEQLE